MLIIRFVANSAFEGLFFQRSRCISLIMTFCDIRAVLMQVNLMEMPHHGNYCNFHSEDLPRNYQQIVQRIAKSNLCSGVNFELKKRMIAD